VTPSPFESFSPNGEDVVLWRALGRIEQGRYVEVSAGDPSRGSVSLGFYRRGWSGIAVQPDPRFTPRLIEQRPRDIVIESAITAGGGDVATQRLDQVLDEAGWQGLDIHFLAVDAEGSERDVLCSIDLMTWRPWVLVVHALQPDDGGSSRGKWESTLLEADYRFCLFDGISCYYVSEEHGSELAALLDHGPCALDDYTTPAMRAAAETAGSIPFLEQDLTRWRREIIGRWARVMAERDELARLRLALGDLRSDYQTLAREHHELAQESHTLYLYVHDMRRSASWRVTQPLRAAIGLLSHAPAGR
jgi:Methyltransferase FkbM domain